MTIPVQCCASQLPVNGARIKCGMVARTAANEIISRRSRRWSGNERLVSLLRRVAASLWRPLTQMLPVDTPLKRSPSVDTVCGPSVDTTRLSRPSRWWQRVLHSCQTGLDREPSAPNCLSINSRLPLVNIVRPRNVFRLQHLSVSSLEIFQQQSLSIVCGCFF